MADSERSQKLVWHKKIWYIVRRWQTYEWLIVLCVLISVAGMAAFLWRDDSCFKLTCPIQFEKFGTFGDFIGGIVGTILAYCNVRLLIKTIGLQDKAVEQSEKSYVNAQKTENVRSLDTQINSLLALYHSNVASISSRCNVSSCSNKGKAAIENLAAEMLKFGDTKSINEIGNEEAISAFELIYASNRDELAVYFRVIYRMLCILQQTDVDNNVRYNYAKVIRSQLTESELSLLRYNSLTYNGEKMQDKILAFNMLKHLPASKLFELNFVFRKLDKETSNHLDVFLSNFRKKMENTFVYGGHFDEDISVKSLIDNFYLSYKVSPNKRKLDVTIRLERSIPFRKPNLKGSIESFADEDLAMFFQAYLIEVFSKAMFQVNTKADELKFEETYTDGSICLSMALECEDKYRTLILTKKQLDKPITRILPLFINGKAIRLN